MTPSNRDRRLVVAEVLWWSRSRHGTEPGSTSTQQLHGEWTRCREPEHKLNDKLQFFAEGYGFVVSQTGVRTPFLFHEFGADVLLTGDARGKMIFIHLTLSDDKTRLELASERSRNGSYYVRSESLASEAAHP